MSKPRRQTYTMEMYLNKVGDMDIRNDADVQRQFVWSSEQINELIVTVLREDYIPPIILGEEESSQLWIVDGGQRTAALKKFRHGNYKITSTVENAVIPYKIKARDKQGKVIVDAEGCIVWEEALFDIKNKTYDKLPDELKKRFNEYQVETVIHEQCDNHRISGLIKRYNNHTSMNTNQKAFTHIDNFARDIREILNSRFFLDYSDYKESEKIKGVVERVIVETIMCSNHLEDWKKQTKAICIYLNRTAEKKEFEKLADNLHRLENIITDETRGIFNSKDSFIFLTLFDRFTKLGIEDMNFARFLTEFKNNFRTVKKNKDGLMFDEIDRGKGTKDKVVIISKLEMLEDLMLEFLHRKEDINKESKNKEISIEEFIAENLNIDMKTLHSDMEFYKESLDSLIHKAIKKDSRLLDQQNRLSLMTMVVYSYKEDVDLDDWLKEYAEHNNTYSADQRENFLRMKKNLNEYNRKMNIA